MLEDITRELPVMRALLHDREFVRRAEQFTDLRELARHHPTEHRTDADAGEVVALSSYMRAAGAVVTMLRRIERLFHEPRKCHRPARRDRRPQFFCEW